MKEKLAELYCLDWNGYKSIFNACTAVCEYCATYKKYANFQFSYVIYGLQLKYIKYKFISYESRQWYPLLAFAIE